MNPVTIRILFVFFLVAHGWVHMSLAQVPVPQPGALRTPFLPAWWRDAVDREWPISKLGVAPDVARMVGWVLWVLVVTGYSLAGAALLLIPGQAAVWQWLAGGASVLSLALLGLYWHPWLPIGVLIDVVLLGGILLRWPVMEFGR